jgi:hypothetical protein
MVVCCSCAWQHLPLLQDFSTRTDHVSHMRANDVCILMYMLTYKEVHEFAYVDPHDCLMKVEMKMPLQEISAYMCLCV